MKAKIKKQAITAKQSKELANIKRATRELVRLNRNDFNLQYKLGGRA